MIINNASILLVDDNRQVLEQVYHILGEEGLEISFIPKGEFLFKRLERQSFDLILLDVNLPGINGYDLLVELRKHPKYHSLPVIIITGEDEDATLTKCFDLGAQDYISKPINHEVLKVRVSSVISASRFHQNHDRQKERLVTEASGPSHQNISSSASDIRTINTASSISTGTDLLRLAA